MTLLKQLYACSVLWKLSIFERTKKILDEKVLWPIGNDFKCYYNLL